MRRIGVLNSLPADDPEAQARHAAFLQGLQEFGWAVGRNVRIDSRWGAGDADRIGKMAAELAAQAPDVILATGGITVAPLLKATRTGHESAAEEFRVTTNKYKEQAALVRDLLEAQARSSESAFQYQQALSSYWSSLADLRRAMGEE